MPPVFGKERRMVLIYHFIAPCSIRCYFGSLLHILLSVIPFLLSPYQKRDFCHCKIPPSLSLRGALVTKQSNWLPPRHCAAEFTLSPMLRFFTSLRMTEGEGFAMAGDSLTRNEFCISLEGGKI